MKLCLEHVLHGEATERRIGGTSAPIEALQACTVPRHGVGLLEHVVGVLAAIAVAGDGHVWLVAALGVFR